MVSLLEIVSCQEWLGTVSDGDCVMSGVVGEVSLLEIVSCQEWLGMVSLLEIVSCQEW